MKGRACVPCGQRGKSRCGERRVAGEMWCLACFTDKQTPRRKYNAAYYAANKARIEAQRTTPERRAANNASKRRWAQSPQGTAQRREYYQINRRAILRKSKAYARAHREQRAVSNKAYKAAHVEALGEYDRLRMRDKYAAAKLERSKQC